MAHSNVLTERDSLLVGFKSLIICGVCVCGCGGGGGAHTLPQLMCASQKTTYRRWFSLSTYRLQKRNSNCETFIAIAFLVEPSGLPAALFKTHAHKDGSGAIMKR